MSNYIKQNFEPGQILTAAQLNHIEEGIDNILPAIENGSTNKVLVLDETGILKWKDKDYGWVMEEQLLYEEFELTRVSESISPY